MIRLSISPQMLGTAAAGRLCASRGGDDADEGFSAALYT